MSKATEAVDKAHNEVTARINTALHTWVKRTQEGIQDRFAPFSRGRGGGGKIQDRTGDLKASFRGGVFGMEARVWSDHPGAGTQEYGDTLRADKAYKGLPGGPYLSFPALENLDSSGRISVSLDRVIKSRRKVWMKIAKGGYILAQSKKDVPRFILKKSVVVKARLGARAVADKVAAGIVI